MALFPFSFILDVSLFYQHFIAVATVPRYHTNTNPHLTFPQTTDLILDVSFGGEIGLVARQSDDDVGTRLALKLLHP